MDLGRAGSPEVPIFPNPAWSRQQSLCLGFRAELMVSVSDPQTVYTTQALGIGKKITELQGLGGLSQRPRPGRRCLFLNHLLLLVS